jgi:hypothetical protein
MLGNETDAKGLMENLESDQRARMASQTIAGEEVALKQRSSSLVN